MTNDERLKRQGRIFNHSGECGKLVTRISAATGTSVEADGQRNVLSGPSIRKEPAAGNFQTTPGERRMESDGGGWNLGLPPAPGVGLNS